MDTIQIRLIRRIYVPVYKPVSGDIVSEFCLSLVARATVLYVRDVIRVPKLTALYGSSQWCDLMYTASYDYKMHLRRSLSLLTLIFTKIDPLYGKLFKCNLKLLTIDYSEIIMHTVRALLTHWMI